MKLLLWSLLPSAILVGIVLSTQPACSQSAVLPAQVVTVPSCETVSGAVVAMPSPTPTPSPAPLEMPAPAMEMQAPAPMVPLAAGEPRLSYNSANVENPVIALTFDDGPKPGQTDRLLDMLKERHIKATFYVIGKNAAEYPALIARMAAEGHEVGNHSWDHPSLSKLSAAGVTEQITMTNEAIVAAGAPQPRTLRPPYGATNAGLNRRINDEFHQKVILWSVDPLDWKIRKSSHVTQEILGNTKAGAIVLAHDIHPSTVDAMPATLDGLIAKGFQFVTVSDLLAMDRPAQPKPPVTTVAAVPKKNKKNH